MKNKIISIAMLTAVNFAFAAGYQVQEQGAANVGTAMAGAVTNANSDASAAFINPAAAFYADLEVGQTQVDASANFVLPSLDFSDRGSKVVNNGIKEDGCVPLSVVPNFYAVHKFSEDLMFTASVTAPFGLESDYEDTWVGRYQGLNSFVFTVDINPGIAYKVNDWLTVGAGVSAQYLYANLTSMVYSPFSGSDTELKLKGKSWGVGGNIGFTVNYMEGGRFGFHWRSAVSHELEGTARLGSTSGDITADMTTPDTFTFGVYQKFLKHFAVMADYSYIRWSEFDKLAVKGFNIMGQPLPEEREDWNDTSRVSLGFHYYPTFWEGATFRIGAAYDESPTENASRTVRIPCSDRVWLSTGLGFDYKYMHFDFAYTYIFLVGDNSIDKMGHFNDTVRGEYNGHIHCVSAQVSFKF